MGCVALVRCVLMLRCGSAGLEWYPYAGFSLHKDTTLGHYQGGGGTKWSASRVSEFVLWDTFLSLNGA
jgi:hypothetical protein